MGIPKLHARIKLLRSLFIPELANNLKELVLRAIAVGKLCGARWIRLFLSTVIFGCRRPRLDSSAITS